MPATLSDSPAGAFRPIYSAPRPRTMSPASSVSSSDERANSELDTSYCRDQSPSSTHSTVSMSHPPVGVTPTSSFHQAPDLSPYTPPHPTPQDTLDATIKPIETAPPKQRRRRTRTIYTDVQLRGLEACFRLTRYPDIETRDNLAVTIGMTEARVQVWFQNRRARLRREERSYRRRMSAENSADTCQSDDVTGSDEVSRSRRFSSVTSEQDSGDQEEQEIDVVSVSEENADPLVTSNPSASSLVGAPLISIAPPQVCTKACCCPPMRIPPFSCYRYRFPSTIPAYHRSFYPSTRFAGFGLPPLPGLSIPVTVPLMYSYRPSYGSVTYQLPTSTHGSTPASSS